MIFKLLTEHHLGFLSLTGGCTGWSESTLVKMSNCWKSYAAAQIFFIICCREDCEYILSKCVDNTKLKSEGKVVKDLCNRLPPTDTGACISVRQYTSKYRKPLKILIGKKDIEDLT